MDFKSFICKIPRKIYEGKESVTIYDYVDSEVAMLANMYKKRLKGYEFMGYGKNNQRVNNMKLLF